MTGTVASSMSSTLIPARLRPPITARLRARAARLVSRLTVTTDPLRSDVPKAAASRTASSGVMSTLASPRTPRGENTDRVARLSHTIDELTTAPLSTVLKG